MDSNYALIQAMFFALAGWIATCYQMVHSRMQPQTRRWLVIPLWFAWMALALGGPVFQGSVALTDAFATVGSFSIGMIMFLLMRRLNSRRQN